MTWIRASLEPDVALDQLAGELAVGIVEGDITTDLDAARNLLLTLSPGSRGLAFLVAPAEATPGKAPDDGLVDQAMQIGWSAIRCTPQSSHRDAWHAATLGAMR